MYALSVASPDPYVHHGSLDVPRADDRLYTQAKTYLARDPQERALFDRLEHAHGRTYHLNVNHRDIDQFDPNSDTISWDPYSALRTTNGGSQSPALGLGHEVDHAVEDPATQTRLANQYDPVYDDAEERRVIRGSEAHAARVLGESVRYDHGGTTYRVASPIDR